MQAAAGSVDVGARAVEEPVTVEPVKRGEPVPVFADVDVEDVGPGQPGGDGDVALGVA